MATSETRTTSEHKAKPHEKRGVPSGLWLQLRRLRRDDLPQGSRAAVQRLPEVRLPHVPRAPRTASRRCSTTARSRSGTPIWRPTDPLEFADKKPYAERLVAEQARTGLRDAVLTGTGMIRARRVAFGVTDSAFIMGSMGSVVGERLTRLIERATARAACR